MKVIYTIRVIIVIVEVKKPTKTLLQVETMVKRNREINHEVFVETAIEAKKRTKTELSENDIDAFFIVLNKLETHIRDCKISDTDFKNYVSPFMRRISKFKAFLTEIATAEEKKELLKILENMPLEKLQKVVKSCEN